MSSSQAYLEQKFRHGFRYLDADCDGLLSADDMLTTARYISKVLGIDEEETKGIQNSWVKWFYYIREDSSVQGISEDKWVAGMKCEYENNLELMKAYSRTSYSDLFDLLDTNKDGQLSLEELDIYYQSHNVVDKAFVKRVFDKLDVNGDGFIQRDELIKAGVNFWWNPDPAEGYGFIYDRPDVTVKK